jgi:hypothetical protein
MRWQGFVDLGEDCVELTVVSVVPKDNKFAGSKINQNNFQASHIHMWSLMCMRGIRQDHW